MADPLRRIWVAAALLFRDVFRRRFALLLIFVVPALFDTVVLLTTAPRRVQVTVAALREELADPAPSGGHLLDLGLVDDGVRRVDSRQLSLVFLGHAAVCFLSCFLAFNLASRRREVDRRLVLAGYRTAEVLAAKLAVLGLILVLLAFWQMVLIRPWLEPRQWAVLALGLLLGGLAYGAIGLLIGVAVKQELEGIFLILLLTNLDPGWLQNPLYFAESQRPELITALPAFAPTQLTVLGAFFDEPAAGPLVARGVLYGAALLVVAVLLFTLRLRPRPAAGAQVRLRRHFAKLLVLTYLGWIVAFQLVGRYAATLHTRDLTTGWDQAIPLIPAFIWPYEACYALPLVALWLFRDWHRFNVGLLGIILASLIAFACYLLVPVAFPRPPLGSSLAERLLAAEFAADFSPGANKLPSLHVTISWILLFATWRQTRRRVVDLAGLTLVVAVTASTLFVKQHLLLDVVTALPLAGLAFALAHRLYWAATAPGDPPDTALAGLLSPGRTPRVPEGRRS